MRNKGEVSLAECRASAVGALTHVVIATNAEGNHRMEVQNNLFATRTFLLGFRWTREWTLLYNHLKYIYSVYNIYPKVYDILLKCLEDYSTDSRGDIGSYVREAALLALQQLNAHVISRGATIG